MDPFITGSIIGAGAGLLGQQNANDSNAKQASLNRRFQERMSNTQHQRAVTDMRKAGLNPILAAGNPNSSPGGAQAQMGNIGTAAMEGASSAASISKLESETAMIDEKLKPVMDQIGQVQAETYLLMAQKALVRMDENHRQSAIGLLTEQTKIAHKEALISDIKYNAIMEGLQALTEDIDGLKFLLPGN